MPDGPNSSPKHLTLQGQTHCLMRTLGNSFRSCLGPGGRNHPVRGGRGQGSKQVGDRLRETSLEQKNSGDQKSSVPLRCSYILTSKATCFTEALLRIHPSSFTGQRDFYFFFSITKWKSIHTSRYPVWQTLFFWIVPDC